jgi:hypothetical protein
MHVAVGANARVTKQVPGTAAGIPTFENEVTFARTLLLQVACSADAGKSGPYNDNIKKFAVHAYIGSRVQILPLSLVFQVDLGLNDNVLARAVVWVTTWINVVCDREVVSLDQVQLQNAHTAVTRFYLQRLFRHNFF